MCVGCMMATADAPCGNCEDEDGSTPGAVPAGWGSGVRMGGTVPAGPPNPVSFLPASIVPPKASHDLPPQRADSEEGARARIVSQADEHQLMMNMLAEQQREMHEEELRARGCARPSRSARSTSSPSRSARAAFRWSRVSSTRV